MNFSDTTTFFNAPRRISRKRKTITPGETPVLPLELVSATYLSGTSVTLTFNQAISIASLDTGYITLADGGTSSLYSGVGGGEMVGTDGVTIELEMTDPNLNPGVFLTAGAGIGIMSVDGGEEWDGVTELALPFGE